MNPPNQIEDICIGRGRFSHGKCPPLTSAAGFHSESVLRSRARSIFTPKEPSAHERSQFSPRNNTPLMSAVRMHE